MKPKLLILCILSLCSPLTKTMEEEKLTSYHEQNAEFVKWFDSKHPRRKNFYSLVIPTENHEPFVTKVIMKRVKLGGLKSPRFSFSSKDH